MHLLTYHLARRSTRSELYYSAAESVTSYWLRCVFTDTAAAVSHPYPTPSTPSEMKKITSFLVLPLFILQACPIHLVAQDNEDEEIFELSPFSVSAADDRGYRATSSLSGNRARTNLKDVASAISVIDASLFQDSGSTLLNVEHANESHYTSATGTIVRFAIGFYHETEKQRRPRLVELLKTVEEAAAEETDLYFTPGALKVAMGDRKKQRGKRKSQFTSYAHFSLSFSLSDGLSVLKRVASIRQLVAGLDIETEVIKVYFGEALLLTASPFSMSAYATPLKPYTRSAGATSDLGGSIPYLINSNGRELRESTPLCSVTLIKPADSVRVPFAFDTLAETEVERIQILNTAVKRIEERVAERPELSFSPGSLLLRHGDAKDDLAKPRSAFTSQMQFAISFTVDADTDALASVHSIRELVRQSNLPSEIAKTHFGAASLVFDNPARYDGEILGEVFGYFEKLQSKLGEGYELIPELDHKRIQHRRYSVTEVELWIPYDYRIESIQERERKDRMMMLEHERILASHEAAARACRRCDENKE